MAHELQCASLQSDETANVLLAESPQIICTLSEEVRSDALSSTKFVVYNEAHGRKHQADNDLTSITDIAWAQRWE